MNIKEEFPRPLKGNWSTFKRVIVKGRHAAKCMICRKTVRNTAQKRLAVHYKFCKARHGNDIHASWESLNDPLNESFLPDTANDDQKLNDGKVGFIGSGNMAKAIFSAMLSKNIIKPSQLYLSCPHVEHISEWGKKGANITSNNMDIIRNCNSVFLAFKPYQLKSVCETLIKQLEDEYIAVEEWQQKVFISILASTSLETLEMELNFPKLGVPKVIRTTPNTPVMVNEGCTVYCLGSRFKSLVDDPAESFVKQVFSAIGICYQVPEYLMDPCSSLCGVGPAFMFLIMEAMSDAGVKMGLPRELAINQAAQTMLGASKMVLETSSHPAMLKDSVCSPGGMTIAGVHSLEKDGVRAAMMNACEASLLRCQEMAKKN